MLMIDICNSPSQYSKQSSLLLGLKEIEEDGLITEPASRHFHKAIIASHCTHL